MLAAPDPVSLPLREHSLVMTSLVLAYVLLQTWPASPGLAGSAAVKDSFELHIHADEAVSYGRVAQIMAIAQHAGVSRLSFMTVAGHCAPTMSCPNRSNMGCDIMSHSHARSFDQ